MSLDRAIDAIERGALDEAYREILATWRAHRDDAVADLLHDLRAQLPARPVIVGANRVKRWTDVEAANDPLDITRQVAFLTKDPRQKFWPDALRALARRGPDPILARALAAALPTYWRSSTGLAIYRQALAMIAAGGTAIDATPFHTIISTLESGALRDEIASLFAKTITKLEASRAPLPEAEAKALPGLRAALAGAVRSAAQAGSRTAALLDAVHAQLDDDGPRLALADHLVGLGDPRGELIALQCQQAPLTPKQRARVRALVDEYGVRWLVPELAKAVLKDGLVYERGFVAACKLSRPSQSVGSRAWATIHTVELGPYCGCAEVLDPICVSLRTVHGLTARHLATIVDLGRPLPFQRIGIDLDDVPPRIFRGLREALPDLRELRTGYLTPGFAEHLPALGRLDRVEVAAQAVRARALLGPTVPEVVVVDGDIVYRVRRATPDIVRVEMTGHAWEQLEELDLTGFERVELVSSIATCKACKNAELAPAQFAARFGVVVV